MLNLFKFLFQIGKTTDRYALDCRVLDHEYHANNKFKVLLCSGLDRWRSG